MFFYENVLSPTVFPTFLYSVLLEEQVLANRYGGWIRASLWRIVDEGWDFEITHMGRGSNNTGNSHFNLYVEDLPGGIY